MRTALVWTDEEIKIITDHVDDSIGELMEFLPGRSYYSIACKKTRILKKYDLTRQSKKEKTDITDRCTRGRNPWTKEEKQILSEKGSITPIGELELLIPNHSRQVIYNYAKRHNIMIMEGRRGRRPVLWEDSCLEYIRSFYPRNGAESCAKALGISTGTVLYLAKKMGVKRKKNGN